MADAQDPSLTPVGKIISFLLVVGLLAFGGYVMWSRSQAAKNVPAPMAVQQGSQAADAGRPSPTPAAPVESALLTEVPRLAAPAPFQMKDNTIDIELSNYPGYSGLVAANNGLAPTEESIFFKKHGFKVKITLSEEESWSALNSGRLAASATTADVLAVYGKQLNVVVPVQIGYSRGADGIVVTSDINRINQLRGKTLATGQFTEAEFFIRYLAQEAGVEVAYLDDLNAKPNADKINLFFSEDAFAAGDLFLEELKAGTNRLAGCVTWAPKTTEVAEGSEGKARVLVTNRNLLIIADVLVVNRPFADANPKIVRGLAEGLLEGNRMVRANPDPYLDLVVKAFNTTAADADSKIDRGGMRRELEKVHLSNLPENLAFFSGDMASGGSFAGIYSSAVLAYGAMIRDPVDSERFANIQPLKDMQAAGLFAGEQIVIQPVKTTGGQALETDPLLSKDIRFFFEPNSSRLEMGNSENIKNLKDIQRMLQVSPGSKVLLRGHVDNARVPEFRKQGGESLVRQMALDAMKLSKNRADEVRKQLLDGYKVDASRLDTIGRGWEEPSSPESDKNRRVEVYWFTLE